MTELLPISKPTFEIIIAVFRYNQLPHYGDTILDCAVYISRSIHDAENQRVLHYICALLNSGGGILHMRNVDHDHQVSYSCLRDILLAQLHRMLCIY